MLLAVCPVWRESCAGESSSKMMIGCCLHRDSMVVQSLGNEAMFGIASEMPWFRRVGFVVVALTRWQAWVGPDTFLPCLLCFVWWATLHARAPAVRLGESTPQKVHRA